ncbi:GntR family transcriptional regulator of abcA and norABC [Evansella vedderi]|uniref:GntR family transcriptional regulator of abcA and norABC n=1 Tax=Evansella vedderi TaxID=38282 RepID=A0ABT9ZX88_9BACI|nr:PLP-dependent aminotransferase family protein [Evansella vedderi]MDQ0255858.1 GntR family transcriptional regulator of abcA and norABC [Evansella vedderi]
MGNTKYKKIVNFITDKITRGEWSIGMKIPSQRELASLFEVNRSTVITALEELKAEGLLESKMGQGTMVTNNTWTLLGVSKPVNWNENVSLGFHKQSMKMVKDINEIETKKGHIQLGKSELSPEMFPAKQLKQIMKKVTGDLSPLSYEEPRGNYQLRQAICSYLEKKGIFTSPDSILIVSGALQALQLIAIGLLRKGSTIFLERPSYVFSLSVFQSAGMDLRGLPMDREGLLVNEISNNQEGKGNTVLYTIPTFHNPTGITLGEERRKELLHVCEKEQIPIIEDDVYGDLWIDDPPPLALKGRDRYGNVLYLGSLSKTLTPGLRIGWIVGPESVIERLSDLKMQTDYGSSSLSQRVALEWLSSGLYESHLSFVRQQLKIRRNVAVKALSQHLKGLASWSVPEGGFFIWVKIFRPLHNQHLFEKALAEGILLNPGNIYAHEANQYIRLSYSYASFEEINWGISQLGKILRSMQ